MTAVKEDQHTRKRIGPWEEGSLPALDQFEKNTNFAVTAAAGSGKTTALVGRMVALVRTGVPVEDLVAITFTRKAAGELRERFYAELDEAAGVATDAAEKKRLQKAKRALPRCFMGTIDAFAGRLLREDPAAVGVAPGFTVDMGDDLEAEARRFWQSYLSDVFESNRDALDRVRSYGVKLQDLRHFFLKLIRLGGVKPYTDGPETMPDLSAGVTAGEALLDEWLPYAPAVLPNKDTLCPTLTSFLKAERLRKTTGLDGFDAQLSFLECFENLYKEDGRKTTDTEYRGDVKPSHWGKNVKDELETLGNEILAPFVMEEILPLLREVGAYIHKQIVAFVSPAVEAFRKERWAKGTLTYNDVLRAARDLLRDNPGARKRLHDRYPRLLVDEFQDTNPLQAELLFFLTGENTSEKNWRHCQPTPGSLFIVGDDKQAIYGFRNADMAIFNEVRELIDEQPCGAAVSLQTNFRSVPGVCNWVNSTFSKLFDVESTYQADYIELDPHRSEKVEGGAVQHRVVPYVKGKTYPADVAFRDATFIASYIKAAMASEEPLVESPTGKKLVEGAPGDFMILTRYTSQLVTYAEALAREGIPYTIKGGKDLHRSPQLRGLVDLLMSVMRPDDGVAWLAFLRGPLVGLSDDALYALKKASKDTDFDPFSTRWKEIPEVMENRVDPETTKLFKKARAAVEKAEAWLEAHAPSVAIGKLMDQVGAMAGALAADGMASLQAGRMLRVKAIVEELEAGGMPWHEIVEQLDAILQGETDDDGMTLQEGTADAVQLLNVHQAKGLEANIVYLADPNGRGSNSKPDSFVDRQDTFVGGEDRTYVPVPTYMGHPEYTSQAWHESIEEEAQAKEDAEERRLQYVAATRAKCRLIMSRYQTNKGKECSGPWQELAEVIALANTEHEVIPEARPLQTFADSVTQQAAIGVAGMLARQHQGRTEALLRVHAPSFAADSVSVHSKKDVEEPTGFGKGRDNGEAFGSVLHDLFEHVARFRPLPTEQLTRPAVVQTFLKRHLRDVPSDISSDARHMLQGWLKSDLWQRVQRASQVLTEVPVAGRLEDTLDAPVLNGTIDLLVEESPGHWLMVDYKTDLVHSEDHLQALTAFYAPQLQTYADLLQRYSNITVRDKGLWFAGQRQWVPIQNAPAESGRPSVDRLAEAKKS